MRFAAASPLEAEQRDEAARRPRRAAPGSGAWGWPRAGRASTLVASDHRAGAVVDRAAVGRDLVAHRRLPGRHRRELVAPDDLPVREAHAEAPRHHHEGDEEQQRARCASRSGPASIAGCLAGRDDERLGQRAEAGVDRLLADGGRLAQAVELVRGGPRPARRGAGARWRAGPARSRWRTRGCPGTARRTRAANSDDDRAEQDARSATAPRRARTADRARRRGSAAAPARARQPRRRRGRTIVRAGARPGRRPWSSRPGRSAGAACAGRGTRSGRRCRSGRGRRGRPRRSDGTWSRWAPLVQLVLAAAVVLAAVGLMALAHGTPPPWAGPAGYRPESMRARMRRWRVGAGSRASGLCCSSSPATRRAARRRGAARSWRAGWR